MTESPVLDLIKPINLPGELAPAADLGTKPELAWLPLERLRIDRSYQHNLTAKSRALIAAIVEAFCWARFQPLTVAPIGGGRYAT